MIERQKQIIVTLGNGDILYRNIIVGVECPKVGDRSVLCKASLLRMIVENPAITRCGPMDEWKTFKMEYQADRWVAEFQAIEEKNLP